METAISAQTVGNQFVSQYYSVLHENPDELHRFYAEKSTLTHADVIHKPNGVITNRVQNATGRKNIKDLISNIGYKDVLAEITSVDSQYSLCGGVLVQVTGALVVDGPAKRSFVQTFFLAVQENGFFVLNDVFRVLNAMNDSKRRARHHRCSSSASSCDKLTKKLEEKDVDRPAIGGGGIESVVSAPPMAGYKKDGSTNDPNRVNEIVGNGNLSSDEEAVNTVEAEYMMAQVDIENEKSVKNADLRVERGKTPKDHKQLKIEADHGDLLIERSSNKLATKERMAVDECVSESVRGEKPLLASQPRMKRNHKTQEREENAPDPNDKDNDKGGGSGVQYDGENSVFLTHPRVLVPEEQAPEPRTKDQVGAAKPRGAESSTAEAKPLRDVASQLGETMISNASCQRDSISEDVAHSASLAKEEFELFDQSRIGSCTDGSSSSPMIVVGSEAASRPGPEDPRATSDGSDGRSLRKTEKLSTEKIQDSTRASSASDHPKAAETKNCGDVDEGSHQARASEDAPVDVVTQNQTHDNTFNVSKKTERALTNPVGNYGGIYRVGAREKTNSESSSVEGEPPQTTDVHNDGLFIRDIPPYVSAEELAEALSKFGPLKPGTLSLKTQKGRSSYAFVDFQSQQAVAACLSTGIELGNGHPIVELKLPHVFHPAPQVPALGGMEQGSTTPRYGTSKAETQKGMSGSAFVGAEGTGDAGTTRISVNGSSRSRVNPSSWEKPLPSEGFGGYPGRRSANPNVSGQQKRGGGSAGGGMANQSHFNYRYLNSPSMANSSNFIMPPAHQMPNPMASNGLGPYGHYVPGQQPLIGMYPAGPMLGGHPQHLVMVPTGMPIPYGSGMMQQMHAPMDSQTANAFGYGMPPSLGMGAGGSARHANKNGVIASKNKERSSYSRV